MPTPRSSASPKRSNEKTDLQNAELRQEVRDLKGLVEGLLRASALECILENGFGELAKTLAPLASLAPAREELPEAAARRLAILRESWRSPDFGAPDLAPKAETVGVAFYFENDFSGGAAS